MKRNFTFYLGLKLIKIQITMKWIYFVLEMLKDISKTNILLKVVSNKNITCIGRVFLHFDSIFNFTYVYLILLVFASVKMLQNNFNNPAVIYIIYLSLHSWIHLHSMHLCFLVNMIIVLKTANLNACYLK